MKSKRPAVQLNEILKEEKERVGSLDADGLPLLGVSNIAGLHRSDKLRIGDMRRYLRVRQNWFAYNPMRINVGSIGWAERQDQAGVVSPDYVVFSCTDRVEPTLVYLFLRSSVGLQAINRQTAGSVRERLYFNSLAKIPIALPPIDEQRRIVARIKELAIQIHEIQTLREEAGRELRQVLRGAFERLVASAPRLHMRDIAPLVRRHVAVSPLGSYSELGIRSFGKGTFHKPTLSGMEIGEKRVFQIEPNDLLFSNVFAWEGAIAVAKREDTGRVGSHRFITCIPKAGVATSRFLCFYFLTNEGLELIRAASPGGAGRNRTLGLAALDDIKVPVPPYEQQLWFDDLQAKVEELRCLQTEANAELNALLPAVLDRAFKGEL